MLVLKDIVKHYELGDIVVEALRGVSIQFRESEFVSVLGPSGCGKTTLLNIIGGLDRYTSGELTVSGLSTKKFKDSDWDTYRNRRVGFVFQTYNLIPHQTVLANVELGLTLSGVSKTERRRRAAEVLNKVGLSDQLYKKPGQISGGQMQRVAIARSLINDPEILLADEPTGSLDSETSVQIMEILKEISSERLVIMVTHNAELASRYSSRIVRLLDGRVIDDTNPYSREEGARAKEGARKQKKPHLTLGTAFALSINNLLTKKTRTFLTAFAGSIGIIGIALILSLSSGMQSYISSIEQETLASYPITIDRVTMDMTAMFAIMDEMQGPGGRRHREPGYVYSNNMMGRVINSFMREVQQNDLKSFKAFLESEESGIHDYVNYIRYSYTTVLNIFNPDTSGGIMQVNPNQLFEIMGMGAMIGTPATMLGIPGPSAMMGEMEVWSELHGNPELLAEQFDVVAGRLPEDFNEVVIIVDRRNGISDFALYSLGLMNPEGLQDVVSLIMQGEPFVSESASFSFDELLELNFRLVLNTDFFEYINGVWVDRSDSTAFMAQVVDNAVDIHVVGILRPGENAVIGQPVHAIGYLPGLMTFLIGEVNGSQIVLEQKANPEVNVFTGRRFDEDEVSDPRGMFDMSELSPQDMMQMMMTFMEMDDDEIMAMMRANMPQPRATFEDNLLLLGVADINNPNSISIYPGDFAAKDAITGIIADYNMRMELGGYSDRVIRYTDIVGLLISSVGEIINAVSMVLIAFIAISLVVSSIMTGVITYISVLERTKEIGILRSIGASKRDISRVFKAETFSVGFVSGTIGIGATLLLIIPANAILYHYSGISGMAALPPAGGVILVAISVVLTLVAGLIPSKIAAKKDPVVALRTE